MSDLILPGSPAFEATLGAVLPPDWQQVADQHSALVVVVRPDTGLMEVVSPEEAREYAFGGEYDLRLEAIGELPLENSD